MSQYSDERRICPDCGIAPCSRHRKFSEDRRLYEHEVLELREENDKLRHANKHMLSLVKDMLKLCDHANPGAFSNGVEASGMDEGDFKTFEFLDRIRTAIKDYDTNAINRPKNS